MPGRLSTEEEYKKAIADMAKLDAEIKKQKEDNERKKAELQKRINNAKLRWNKKLFRQFEDIYKDLYGKDFESEADFENIKKDHQSAKFANELASFLGVKSLDKNIMESLHDYLNIKGQNETLVKDRILLRAKNHIEK